MQATLYAPNYIRPNVKMFNTKHGKNSGGLEPNDESYVHYKYINIWTIIITAIVFFAVTAWYDFFTVINDKGINWLDPDSKASSKSKCIFALFWTVFAVLAYVALDGTCKLRARSVYTTSPYPPDH